jgi:hypothetical protein
MYIDYIDNNGVPSCKSSPLEGPLVAPPIGALERKKTVHISLPFLGTFLEILGSGFRKYFGGVFELLISTEKWQKTR